MGAALAPEETVLGGFKPRGCSSTTAGRLDGAEIRAIAGSLPPATVPARGRLCTPNEVRTLNRGQWATGPF